MAELRDFELPDLGEGLTEAEVVRWLVAVGDRVEVDQPVAEVSTAKAEVQVPTPFAGVVSALHAEPGETVQVGRPLISVEVTAGSTAPKAGAEAEPAPVGGSEGMADSPAEHLEEPGSGNVLVGYGTTAATSRRRRVVTAADLERHLTTTGAGAAEAAAEERRVPLRGPRRITAERLSRSHAEVPAATAWLAADASALLELRGLINSREDAVHVTPLAVLLRLCVAALQRFPAINASYDAERAETVLSAAIHLGVATETERGLMVPVIRDAQRLSIVAIAAELSRLAIASRDGRVDAAELRGSTFTVSNFGGLGVDGGVAIINPPEAAILGCGRISPRPWVVDGAVVVRPVIELSLAFDHRACDGADAAGFLRLLGDLVEHPELALG